MKWVLLSILSLWVCSSIAYQDIRPLPSDQAFVFSSHSSEQKKIMFQWNIAPGYYLYKDKIRFTFTPSDSVHVDKIVWPTPQHHKNTLVYTGPLSISILMTDSNKPVTLAIDYQGCSLSGFCYPPVTKYLHINNSFSLSQTHIEKIFDGHNLIFIIFSFLGLGLLLAFTPCVLPMIPILSSIIVGHGKKTHTWHAFNLSLSYVIGMAATYALAGLVVASVGSSIQTALEKPWVIFLFSGLFVLLALSLFSFYDLQLPSGWRQRINAWNHRLKGGSFVGVFLMGCLSTLIVSPCLSAPLVGVLAYIAQSGDKILGTLALLALGLGMGIPLLLIGTSFGKYLPKAGPWMNWIKNIFGILMLGMAAWMLGRIIPFTPASHTFFTVIKSERELDQTLLTARQQHKPVVLDFYAQWCTSCVYMDKHLFQQKKIRDSLANIVRLRVDITKQNAFDQQVMQRYHVIAPPVMVFFDSKGNEFPQHIVGEIQAKELLPIIATVKEP